MPDGRIVYGMCVLYYTIAHVNNMGLILFFPVVSSYRARGTEDLELFLSPKTICILHKKFEYYYYYYFRPSENRRRRRKRRKQKKRREKGTNEQLLDIHGIGISLLSFYICVSVCLGPKVDAARGGPKKKMLAYGLMALHIN